MTIGWLKIRWHCVVLVDEHRLLFTTQNFAENISHTRTILVLVLRLLTYNLLTFGIYSILLPGTIPQPASLSLGSILSSRVCASFIYIVFSVFIL